VFSVTRLQKIARVYREIALHSFNTLILLGLAAVVFLICKANKAEKADNPVAKYGMAKLQRVYPERTPDQIALLLDENWGRPLQYEAYTHFTEAAYQGKYVNVSSAGFRLVENQGPWPPEKQNLNIFVFGGSTTFGYGVADAETIPSVLQRKLQTTAKKRVCVYNYGRGHYYSTQERILFSNLLIAGFVPDVAIFIDGLNEFYYRKDAPEYSSHFMRVINENFHLRKKPSEELTIEQLIQRAPSGDKNERSDDAVAAMICERYLLNKQLIDAMAQARGIETVFVWQPVPTYGYDLRHHQFAQAADFGRHRYSATGYTYMAALRETNRLSTNELWLADMQREIVETLYVDAVHYSPNMCERVATAISKFMHKSRGVTSASNGR
jgi:hypothetical protein